MLATQAEVAELGAQAELAELAASDVSLLSAWPTVTVELVLRVAQAVPTSV